MRNVILILFVVFFVLNSICFAETQYIVVSSAPSAGGTWSSGIIPGGTNPLTTYKGGEGFLCVSIYGASWAGTVTLQKLCHNTSGSLTWCDVKTYTANTQKALIDYQANARYRIGMKYGEYTSGSIRCELTNAGGW